jgi:hypothetical protein
MAEKTEFVLGANFGTPSGSGSQLIFFLAIVYSVIHQYLFMADTVFEYLKYQLDQKRDHFLKIPGVNQVVSKSYRCSQH